MTTTSGSSPSVSLARRALGRPADWHLDKKPLSPTRLLNRVLARRPGMRWFGPLAVLGSVAASWPAFAGASGDGGNVAFGLFIGAVSIVLMSWSFVLAVRIRPLERFFSGLDGMYRVHRWAGTLAVVAMFLHTSIEPEIDGGIRGAGRALADNAEDLAGVGEYMLYGLIAISLLRWIPYRFWRWTHKLLGVPFIFASFHFVTAEKPYANSSLWGWWFGAFMIAGIVAYLWRVVLRDVIARGRRYRVVASTRRGSTLELELEPVGAPVNHRAGQFAVLKVQRRDLAEPHLFTIASSPHEQNLRFFIRDLGDWTAKLQQTDLDGLDVLVEGPYGQFDPLGDGHGPTVWVAGGVGITPFLSAAAALAPQAGKLRPLLYYCVKDRSDATALELLQRLEAEGRIELEVCASSEGRRFDRSVLAERFTTDGLTNAHVAVCGPAGLVRAVEDLALDFGATEVEREDFDIRQGFGPDLSKEIDSLLATAKTKVRSRLD